MEGSEGSKLIMPSQFIKQRREEYRRPPQFDRKSVEDTAKQMFRGCSVHWSKTAVKGHRAVIMLSGDKDPKDLVPVVLEGKLPNIAKTLIVMFAAVQHLVVRNMADKIKLQQKAEEKKIHVGEGIQQNKPDVANVQTVGNQAPRIHR